ncbi:hypothetical protein [Methanobrevibacter sp. UBA212]|uniref:hypothetical protein n=1 Tax=Methanobrevibacter sp. UBA212 TaxID=1915476 RepID=UPI0025E6B1F8|nr:hypothetical protein [Methanobrevibacter sp. UBA212]
MNSYSPFKRQVAEIAPHNQFDDNYHGILTHKGEIKVAKGDMEQEILYIDDDGIVLVDGMIHSKLLGLIHYAAAGDIGLIKFIRGEAFIVGFRKTKGDD